MKNNFLDDLKKAVDEGNFNSDAAKKINKIDELANKKASGKSEDELKESINEKIESEVLKKGTDVILEAVDAALAAKRGEKDVSELYGAAKDMYDSMSEDELKNYTSSIKTVDKDKIADLNSEYEEKMSKRAEEEVALATIATLNNMDYNIEKEIDEILTFIQQQKNKYDLNDGSYPQLYEKIEELTNKYKHFERK